jgi:hypothetical protein
MSKLVVIMLAVLLLVCGCATGKSVATQQPTSTLPEAVTTTSEALLGPGESHIKRQLGANTSIDAQVTVPADRAVSSVDIALPAFGEGSIETVLFRGERTSSEEARPGLHVVRSENTADACSYSSLGINSNLVFQTAATEYVFNVFHWRPDDTENNLAQFSTTAELPFATRDAVTSAVLDAVQKLGVKNLGEFVIYALDHEQLGALEKEMKSSGNYNEYKYKNEWTDDDDCYFLTMPCSVSGLPVDEYDTQPMIVEQTVQGSNIAALYSHNGLEYLQVTNFCSSKGVGQELPVVSFEAALGTIVNKLELLITTSKYTITDVRMKYVFQFKDSSRTTLKLAPAWYFTVNEAVVYTRDGVEYRDNVTHRFMIDAHTGKEM